MPVMADKLIPFDVYRYDSEGKGTALLSIGSDMSPSTTSGARSMYSDRVTLSFIASNPSLGEDKVIEVS